MIGQSLSSAHISVHAYIFAFVRVDKKIVYAVRCLSLKLKSSVTAPQLSHSALWSGSERAKHFLICCSSVPFLSLSLAKKLVCVCVCTLHRVAELITELDFEFSPVCYIMHIMQRAEHTVDAVKEKIPYFIFD